MAINSKILFAASAALLAALPISADDAKITPQDETQPATQVVAAPVTPPPAPIARAAAAYGTFQKDVGELHARGLSSTADIDHALKTLAGQNPAQLSRGWLAYASLVAAQSPELRTSVREVVAAYGRDGMSAGLASDRGYVRRVLAGGDEAVALAFAATNADSVRLSRSASYFREQAYALQGHGWAKARLRAPQMNATVDRLIASSRVERAPRGNIVTALQSPTVDVALRQAGTSGATSLWDGVIDASNGIQFPSLLNPSLRSQKVRIGQDQAYIANQIATLAAYQIMGTDAQNASQVRAAMGEGPMRACINYAQLNVNQCVQSNSAPFETVDCLGKHAVGEVSECFGEPTN